MKSVSGKPISPSKDEQSFDGVCNRFKLTSLQRYALKLEAATLAKIGVQFDLELSAIRHSYSSGPEYVAGRILPADSTGGYWKLER